MQNIVNTLVSVDLIQPHRKNYRKHPEQQLKALQASHQRFSQYRSVVLWKRPDGTYVQVAGHGIVEAMKRNGIKEVRADILDEHVSAEEIEGILLADNLHAENSDSDEFLLLDLLDEQQKQGFDLESIGYTEAAYQALLEKLRPPSFEEIASEYGEESKPEDFWPTIRLRVPQETKTRFEDLMEQAEGDNEAERFAHLLSLLETEEMEDDD